LLFPSKPFQISIRRNENRSRAGLFAVVSLAKVIAVTNSSGVASVTLSLPATAGPVTVTAEGPYGLGHPTVTPFTETAQ